jgi:hypothetical protein
VHGFIPLDCSLGAIERAKAEARIHPSFDRTVILFNDIVQIGNNAAATSLAEYVVPLQLLNDTWIRRIPVHVDHAWTTMSWGRQRLAEEGSGGG